MIQYRNSIKNINPYVPGKPIEAVKKELGLTDVIKLASNENPLGCSPSAKRAIINCFDNISTYPDGNCSNLRAALSNFYSLDQDWFFFGTGTDECISMLANAYIDEGSEMLTADNTFSQYATAVDAIGGTTVYAPMKSYTFDLNEILKRITSKTKIIFIANPNNPTGTIITKEEQLEFVKKVPSNVLIVFDEAYSEYVDDKAYPETLKMVRDFENVVMLKTFSKIYGLASLRVGYGIMRPALIEPINRIRKPFNVSTAAQEAAIESLKDNNFVIQSYEANKTVKNYLYRELDKMDLPYILSQANFVMVDVKKDSRLVFSELLAKGYIVRPGSAFNMDTFLRVTVGTMEQMKGFIEALKSSIKI